MPGDVTPYLGLVTSEHRPRPKFIASLVAVTQATADEISLLLEVPGDYDLDTALGVQLDVVGEWAGITRYLQEPITGVYFSWSTTGVGWSEGSWKGPFDPATGLVALPDDQYRILIRATIAANQWDGTIPGAYAIWGVLFPDQGLLIQDNGDMSMILAITAPDIDSVTLALITQGYIKLKPAGVKITYVVNGVPGAPVFGWGVDSDYLGGWGDGAWGKFL